ncbi:MAG TPA: hypothetical protein VFQ59_01055 [Candidatus Paceibacterota bacterium]|nr:hypothetical protein [Candidatus Paceibacterota bacterium]
MPKNVFQDMVTVKRERQGTPPKRIDIPPVRESFTPPPPPPPPPPPRTPVESPIPRERREGPRYGIWFLATVAVIFLFFAVSLLFVNAKVSVNPEQREVSLSKTFSAVKGGMNGALPFDLLVLSGQEEKIVAGGEEKEVIETAKGKVKIFNEFSSAPQALDINTRLEGSNQKIYKTVEKVVVPGMASDGTPGSIEVDIYASEPGKEYNSAPLDFKIFGFKGGPKYEKFYARSQGEISGGASGVSMSLSDSQKENAVIELENTLREKLLEKVRGQIPNGFVLWDDAIFVEMEEETLAKGSEPNTTLVVVKGVLYGFLFDEKRMSTEIINEAISDFDGSEAYVSNLKDLEFTLLDRENITSGNVNTVKNINFSLAGKPKVVYRISSESLASELAGKNKKDFERILSRYPHIDTADLSIRPVWKSSIPESTKDIEVVVNYP